MPWTSSIVVGVAVPIPTLPNPVICWLLPVMFPPRVKALIVKVPVEFEIVSVFKAEDSKVWEEEAFTVNTWPVKVLTEVPV